MRKRVRFYLAIGSLLLASTMSIIIPMSDIMASTNSAQTHWEGIDSSGAVVMDEECPIEVQHEKLVIDLFYPPLFYC